MSTLSSSPLFSPLYLCALLSLYFHKFFLDNSKYRVIMIPTIQRNSPKFVDENKTVSVRIFREPVDGANRYILIYGYPLQEAAWTHSKARRYPPLPGMRMSVRTKRCVFRRIRVVTRIFRPFWLRSKGIFWIFLHFSFYLSVQQCADTIVQEEWHYENVTKMQ